MSATDTAPEAGGHLRDVDPYSRQQVRSAKGLLRDFNAAEVIGAADVHVARRLAALLEEEDEQVHLATALAVAAVRQGSVCVDLTTVAAQPVEVITDQPLGWPDPDSWLSAVTRSPLVTQEVLRLEGTTLYLDRYWREEVQVCADLLARLRRPAPEVDRPLLEEGLGRVFPGEGYGEQRDAAMAAAGQWTTVLTGGPGTGKTTTVAGLLALLGEQYEREHGRAPRIALSAPTGKAAARLQEAVRTEAANLPSASDRERVGTLTATTLHRLLGWRPGSSTRFRHDRTHRLAQDVVVVDEASMVSLTMMARLLEAVGPATRLILVGDPDQLSSVEAGAVLADLVAGFRGVEGSPVVQLRTVHRFEEKGAIAKLAQALRDGDPEAVVQVLAAGGPGVTWVDPEDPAAMEAFRDRLARFALDVRLPAEQGDAAGALAALRKHRLLCAHRNGPYGVSGWNRQIERMVAERTGVVHYDEWYAGRPVLVTANDRVLHLSNGDMGVAVHGPAGLRVALETSGEPRDLAPTRLADVQTVHAMTVHKAQGSQAETVSVLLPPEESPLLTRELLYTAVTRAQRHVVLVASEASVRTAVAREVQRASGLRNRLRHP